MPPFLKTDLRGKIQNMPNFHSEALLPLFEAVVNSIQAIQDNTDLKGNGTIVVTVNREASQQQKMSFASDEKIIGFEVEDNGVGFDDANFESFQTSDTTYKFEKGCKGVGRFFWLKAFDRVEIDSVFWLEKRRLQRRITFTAKDGIESEDATETEQPQKTTVRLIGFKEEYRKQPSAYKTTQKIAQRILEHCLSYFITENAPKITVCDLDESYDLHSMYMEIKDGIATEVFEIDNQFFNLSHVKLNSTHSRMHNLVLCASSRHVQQKSISSTLGVSAEFDDSDKKFVYAAYLSSPYLDKHVDSARMTFSIPEEPLLIVDDDAIDCEPGDPQGQISLKEIEEKVIEKTKEHLAPYLEALQKRKEAIVTQYVSTENPTLRFVPYYNPAVYDEIQPNTSNEKLDEILYKYKGKAEYEIKKRGTALLKKQVESYAEIEDEAVKIEEQLEGIQKDQLASYIIFRKLIIDLLDKKLELNRDGKHANEDIIHDIIFPRKTTTDAIPFENHNLWLIDERLAFHSFAVSDKKLSEYTDTDSADRPDIVVFSEVDADRIARSISIVELKKPQREKHEENVTTQLFRYVRQIKNKKIKTYNGRDFQVSDATRFYCYAICDIAEPVRIFAEDQRYTKLKDGLGYYAYNSDLNTHIEIIAFDKIVADANMRHRIFFEKLGIYENPTSK